MTTEIVNSSRTFAAIRAQRSMVAAKLASFTNPVARAGLEHALALYDAELVGAPAKAAKIHADRKSAAFRAHRTMLLRRLTGTRGKVRAELKAKLAEIEAKIAA